MKRFRGFRIGRHIMRFWRQTLMRRRPNNYIRLTTQTHKPSTTSKPSSTMAKKLLNCCRGLTRRLGGGHRNDRKLDVSSTESLLREAVAKPPPKGYLAVYVGGGEGSPGQRYLVPVIYFNHPLFGELLREAEEESGFYHPGVISIPCPAAEFESVRRRIAGGTVDKYYQKRCTWDDSYSSYKSGPVFI